MPPLPPTALNVEMCILRLIKVLSKHFWLTKKIFSFSKKKKKKKFHIRFSKPQCKCVCPFLPYVILKTETMSSIWSHKMPYLFYQLAVLFKKKKKSFYWPIKLMGHCKVFNYLSQLVLLIMRHDLGVWGGDSFLYFLLLQWYHFEIQNLSFNFCT